MLDRDRDRFADAAPAPQRLPLGAGALAGSTLPLDRNTAHQLGFTDPRGRPRISQNSMDAVSDRDFVIEFAAAAASRRPPLPARRRSHPLGHQRVRLPRIADAYTTGSSLMPQKKNPDVAELPAAKPPGSSAISWPC
jgi:argininosuccinate lyase